MSVADRLDEVALRREGFRDGPKLVLGDGQEWTFPRPRIRFFPVRNKETLQVESRFAASYGRDYELKIDQFLEADPEDVATRLMLQVEMAAMLLLQNYDVGDEALSDLLSFDFEDPDNVAMWNDIIAVLLGRAPKASPDGSV